MSERSPEHPKILYVIPALVQGGAERQILELLRGVDATRFEASLCVFSLDGLHYEGLLPAGEPRHVVRPGVFRFARLLRAERPDIVHSFMDRANFYARVGALLAGRRRPAVVTSVRGPLMPLRFLAVERLLSRFGARIVTNSQGIARELTRYGRVPRERVQVIGNVVNPERFGPASAAERQAAREELGLQPHAVVGACVGWIGLAKYHVGLALALWRLRRAGDLPSSFVVLAAGRVRDRLPAWVLPRWVAWLEVEDLLRFLGPVKEIRRVWAAADFAVVPSLYEGLSNALLEAMASGLPVVVSEGANRDGLVQDGDSGFVFRTGSTRAMAEALAKVIALSPAERRAMGERARARVLAELPPERPLRETMALYEEILARRGLGHSDALRRAGEKASALAVAFSGLAGGGEH